MKNWEFKFVFYIVFFELNLFFIYFIVELLFIISNNFKMIKNMFILFVWFVLLF